MAKITYDDKSYINLNADIPATNKIQDTDMNEIKSVVNTNDDKVGELSSLNTTDKSSIVDSINEVNLKFLYSSTETICGTWINGKNIYRQAYTGNNLALNSNSWVETPVSIPGESFIIEAKIINNENGQVMPLCAYTTSSNKLNVLNVRSGNVSYSLGYTIIVEYTKSTD